MATSSRYRRTILRKKQRKETRQTVRTKGCTRTHRARCSPHIIITPQGNRVSPFLRSFQSPFLFFFFSPQNDQRNRGCLGSCLPGTGYCKKCSNFKPYRAHHCSTCNTCVQLMDHHCPWPVTRNAAIATSTGHSHRQRALEGTCWMCTSKTEPAPRPVSRLGVAVCCSPVVADVCGLC